MGSNPTRLLEEETRTWTTQGRQVKTLKEDGQHKPKREALEEEANPANNLISDF